MQARDASQWADMRAEGDVDEEEGDKSNSSPSWSIDGPVCDGQKDVAPTWTSEKIVKRKAEMAKGESVETKRSDDTRDDRFALRKEIV